MQIPSPTPRPSPRPPAAHPAKHVVLWGLFTALVGFSYWKSRHSGADAPAEESPFELREVGAERGINFVHRTPILDERIAPILPQVAGTGAAVAITDVNGDGWMDLYTVTSRGGEPNALYVNDGTGKFTDRAAEAGLGAINADGVGVSHGSLWADLDRDGDQDVLVYMWGRSRLFRNDSAGDSLVFTDVTDDAGLVPWMHCSAACFIDFDRDGDLDVFLGGYYRETINLWELENTRILHNDQEFAENGGRNFLLRNEGGLVFSDVSDAVGIGGSRWTYGVVAADFDGDGWQDLYIANDYGAEEFYTNTPADASAGPARRFVSVSGLGLDSKSKSGMCVAVGDIGNKGELAVYITNISEPSWLMQGNNLRLVRSGEKFDLNNVAGGATSNCGWAWGADFGDLDLDGWQDIVVVNGFRSKNKDREYWFQMSKLATATGALLEDAANWTPFDDMSLSGYQRTRVLMNRGRRASFRDAAEAAGITDLCDGRSVALADLDNDGSLDIVVANQEGPLLLYENGASGGAWVGLSLVGSTSNPDGVGARVTARFTEAADGEREEVTHVQTQIVTAGHGFCTQTDPRVHFGLGHARLESIEVLWPSGVRQELTEPRPRTYHVVTEPRE